MTASEQLRHNEDP